MSKESGLDLKGLSEKARAPEPESVKIPVPPSALTPEMQAFISMSISEAVKSVFVQMTPVLASIALTPEKMAEAERLRRAPDAAVVAREMRERKLTQDEATENAQNLARRQNDCFHRYPSGLLSISLIRNYPDRQARGICMTCHKMFQPRRWEIGAPTELSPRGVPFVADADKQYSLVLEVLSAKG